MGGFYGSVQVRSESRETVLKAAAAVTERLGIKALVGPSRSGWVGIYPENGGQDESVGEAVAQVVGGTVLQILVHDDDVLAWWHWRDGVLVDRLWSKPGYFIETERESQARLTGDPNLFDWLDEGARRRVASLIAPAQERVFEYERLQELGRLLGIDNVVTSYEYLKNGEREGIKAWRQFREVPVSAAKRERDAERAARRASAEARRKLEAEGRLLHTMTEPRYPMAAAAAKEGYLLFRADGSGSFIVEHYRPPFQEIEIATTRAAGVIVSAATEERRQWVALAGGSHLLTWNVEQRGVHHIVQMLESAYAAALHPYDDRVAVATRHGLCIVDLDTDKRGPVIDHKGTRQIAWHPSGEWWVANGNTLVVVEGDGRHAARWVGGRNEMPQQLAAVAARQMAGLDIDKIRAQAETAFSNMVKSMGDRATPQMLEQMRAQMEASLGQVLAHAKRFQTEGPPATSKEHAMCVGFTRDGRWLWVGTQVGLRVYDAAEVRAGSGDMPAPRFRSESFGESAWAPVYVYAAAEADDGRLLFVDSAGRLRALDLGSGTVDLLAEHPDRMAFVGLVTTGDTCATLARHTGYGKKHENTWVWQIWRI